MNVTSSKLTFELEHDARIISRMTAIPVAKVELIMRDFVSLDLFTASEGRIQCLKLAKRSDDFTAKAIRQNGLQAIESKGVRQSPTKSDKVPLEDRSKNVEVEKNKDLLSVKTDAVQVLEYMNENYGKNYKPTTKSHLENINARLNEGATVDECKAVIDFKYQDWKGTTQEQYFRPQTLFQPSKFDGYLAASKIGKPRNVNTIGTDFSAPEGWN